MRALIDPFVFFFVFKLEDVDVVSFCLLRYLFYFSFFFWLRFLRGMLYISGARHCELRDDRQAPVYAGVTRIYGFISTHRSGGGPPMPHAATQTPHHRVHPGLGLRVHPPREEPSALLYTLSPLLPPPPQVSTTTTTIMPPMWMACIVSVPHPSCAA